MNTRTRRRKGNRQSRRDNAAWTKSTNASHSGGSAESILFMRCDTATDGLKIGYLVNSDEITTQLPAERIAKRLATQLPPDSQNRPLSVVTYGATGTPLVAKTPGNTILYKDQSRGALYLFSNREAARIAYEQSSQCKQVNDFLLEIKSQKVEITEAQQTRVLRERQQAQFRRPRSQKAVMGESAHDHVTRHQMTLTGLDFDWAHELAISLVGAVGQEQDNLVATTAHANTDMIFAESEVPLLRRHYPQGFNLEVTAYVYAGTHIAKSIEYKITTRDFEKTYQFDGQTTIKPHVAFKQYFHALAKALIPHNDEVSPQKQSTPYKAARSPFSPVSRNASFFSKKAKASEDQGSQELKKRKLTF